MQEKLKAAIGKLVRLENYASIEIEDNKLQIHVVGTLQHDEENNTYCVMVGEHPSGHGLSYVSFNFRNVIEVCKQPSGIISIDIR